jgi:hypothetical protein
MAKKGSSQYPERRRRKNQPDRSVQPDGMARLMLKPRRCSMWSEAAGVAIIGSGVVFITLVLLAFSIRIMSFVCVRIVRKGGKQ